MIRGLMRLLIAVIVGTVVGALLFAAIDWLRTFEAHGVMVSVAQKSLLKGDVVAADQLPQYAGLLGWVNGFIDWYSSVFFGYSRFGSGLGTLIGAFWAAGAVKKSTAGSRIAVGGLAGFIIGVRSAMFVVSRPDLVLGIGFLGFAIGAGYLYVCGLPSKFAPLPRLQFKHGP